MVEINIIFSIELIHVGYKYRNCIAYCARDFRVSID